MKTKIQLLIAVLGLALFTGCASSGVNVTGAKPYPLKTCLVTDNDLNSMGDEQVIVYEGRVIKFCCAPCVKKFRQNPAKYLSKLGN